MSGRQAGGVLSRGHKYEEHVGGHCTRTCEDGKEIERGRVRVNGGRRVDKRGKEVGTKRKEKEGKDKMEGGEEINSEERERVGSGEIFQPITRDFSTRPQIS